MKKWNYIHEIKVVFCSYNPCATCVLVLYCHWYNQPTCQCLIFLVVIHVNDASLITNLGTLNGINHIIVWTIFITQLEPPFRKDTIVKMIFFRSGIGMGVNSLPPVHFKKFWQVVAFNAQDCYVVWNFFPSVESTFHTC